MAMIEASAAAPVAAPAERVYEILADYRQHHPRILPPAFSDLVVEEGGVGAGTVLRFRVKLGGSTRTVRARVTEPQPGGVLAETDEATGAVTTFTVTPAGEQSRVRIETRYQARGIGGWMQGLLAPRLLRSLYRDELVRLDRYTRSLVA